MGSVIFLIVYLTGFVIAYLFSLWTMKSLWKKINLQDILVSLALAVLSYVGILILVEIRRDLKRKALQKENDQYEL